MTILNLILAILVPPIRTLLQVDWPGILLTVLGVFPAMVHAVWLVATNHIA